MPTAREQARDAMTAQILAVARRQLADVGPQQLSLRAVAREIGVVSSAVYRYVPSRDDLLTALIVQAYDEVGAAAEVAEAAVPRPDHRGRWVAACTALWRWARDHPQEYALVYGSPVPGYRAPRTTVEPAGRVARLVLRVLEDAAEAGVLDPPGASPSGRRGMDAALVAQMRSFGATFAPSLTPEVCARALAAWTQLLGTVSADLFGHLVGSADPADAFVGHVVHSAADQVGLPPGRR
ncbi:TetR/AcrR family transcriptional regulator [Thalassiella azotivora]